LAGNPTEYAAVYSKKDQAACSGPDVGLAVVFDNLSFDVLGGE
jgi:hypothetical protein